MPKKRKQDKSSFCPKYARRGLQGVLVVAGRTENEGRTAEVNGLKDELRRVIELRESDADPAWLNGFAEHLVGEGLDDLEKLAETIYYSMTTGFTPSYNASDTASMDECDIPKVRVLMKECGVVKGIDSTRFVKHLTELVEAQKIAASTKVQQRTQSSQSYSVAAAGAEYNTNAIGNNSSSSASGGGSSMSDSDVWGWVRDESTGKRNKSIAQRIFKNFANLNEEVRKFLADDKLGRGFCSHCIGDSAARGVRDRLFDRDTCGAVTRQEMENAYEQAKNDHTAARSKKGGEERPPSAKGKVRYAPTLRPPCAT